MKKSDMPPKSSIAKRIEKMLIEEISTGQIEPGTRLDENSAGGTVRRVPHTGPGSA